MLFTGINFRTTPEINQLGFVFENKILDTTGIAEVGFSGEGNSLKFKFISGSIYSPENKIAGFYNTNELFSISGYIDTGTYQYYINNDLIANRKTKSNYLIQNLIVNSTGTGIISNIKLLSPNIDYTLFVNENFGALTNLSGYISNNSTYNIRIFDSDITYFQSSQPVLSGEISGILTGSASLNFQLQDLNTSRFDSELEFLLVLNTSIGKLSNQFLVNRVSGLEYTNGILSGPSGAIVLSGLFDGTGSYVNKFVFLNTPVSDTKFYYVSTSNLKGEQKPSNISISLQAASPLNGSGYRADYVTGFSFSSSGAYQSIPKAVFSGYYFVSDLNYNLNTILLSSGCSGSVPIIFSGSNGGSGASGLLLTNSVSLSNVYDVGTNTYYLPYDFQVLSGGTGYRQIPSSILRTGIYSNCYDVAAKYGYNNYSFAPFSGLASISALADYLTGVIKYTTGFVSGGLSGSGYLLTGLEITNPGSGFNQTYYPQVRIIRQAGDTFTGIASGSFTTKSTGYYDFTGAWSLYTGLSNAQLTKVDTLSGNVTLNSGQNYVAVQINYSGIDNTEPITSRLVVSMSGIGSITGYVTGNKYYDTTTGFLKKKNNLNLLLFGPSEDLSFLLTQSELDTYYSSSQFLNNSFVFEDGDLDF